MVVKTRGSRTAGLWLTGILLLMLCCSAVAAEVNEVPAGEQPAQEQAVPAEQMDEVLVKGSSDPTRPTLETEKLLNLPGTMGDPIYSVFSLPGVLFSGGDFGQPAVRGSAPEDNAFQIDFLPAGYIYHPFGFSIFN